MDKIKSNHCFLPHHPIIKKSSEIANVLRVMYLQKVVSEFHYMTTRRSVQGTKFLFYIGFFIHRRNASGY
jgi:hypothetical protein